VNTEDGYILKMFRISGAKNSKGSADTNEAKKVVLLQHGLVVKLFFYLLKFIQFVSFM